MAPPTLEDWALQGEFDIEDPSLGKQQGIGPDERHGLHRVLKHVTQHHQIEGSPAQFPEVIAWPHAGNGFDPGNVVDPFICSQSIRDELASVTTEIQYRMDAIPKLPDPEQPFQFLLPGLDRSWIGSQACVHPLGVPRLIGMAQTKVVNPPVASIEAFNLVFLKPQV
jgi:hypothetical protein